MSDIFKIFIDRLKAQDFENIDLNTSPDFLKVNEKELSFKKSILIKGKAYIAQDNLIIDLNIKTYYNMPCAICNKIVENFLEIKRFMQVIILENIKNSVFDFSKDLRDEILLQIPQFTECNLNQCEQRSNLKKYLKTDNQGYFPFKELKL